MLIVLLRDMLKRIRTVCVNLGGTINSRMFYGKQIYIAVNKYSFIFSEMVGMYFYDPCIISKIHIIAFCIINNL